MLSKHAESFVKAVFHTPAAMADEAAGLLVARGALGCAVREQARPDSPRKTVTLDAYFRRLTRLDLAAIGRAMASAGMLARDAHRPRRWRPRATRVTDPGWSTLWMKRFKPIRVGRRFLIVPPWIEPPDPRRLAIVIKPGRAFGTGHHPTTAGVLRALEQLCATRHFRSALDVGTGSGVLAIAIKMLGVEQVAGVDVDRDAIENARENLMLNNLKKQVKLSSAPLGRLRRRFDLIVANIRSATIIALAPVLTRLLARDGRIVLAGIPAREAGEVIRSYRPGLRCVAARSHRGWTTLVLKTTGGDARARSR